MPSNDSRLGNAIVSALKGAGYYASTTSDREQRSISEWTVIAGAILKEIRDNMDISLESADIKIDPGTFLDSDARLPIVGIAVNEPVTLTGKLR